jgi:hypothetical protein
MMDINGLVNPMPNGRVGSITPPSNIPSESGSHLSADSARLYPPLLGFPYRDRDEGGSPNYITHSDPRTLVVNKRPLEIITPPFSTPPTKRRQPEIGTDSSSKTFPTRRRALQACEACRAKKSKCDNERPSCGSCIQHGVECVYKGSPYVPV